MAGSLIYFGLGFYTYPIVVPCCQSQCYFTDQEGGGKVENKQTKKGKREKENRLHTLSFGIHYIHSNHRAKYYVVTDR